MQPRVRLRELGIKLGQYEAGPWNSITDVAGVRVGHRTIQQDLSEHTCIRTGVTAILPHAGNLFREKVLGTCHVINGFGKTTGTVQLQELGLVESPIMLTNTLSVPAVAEGTIRHMLRHNPDIGDTTGTVNVIVGECNDGYLNDIRGLHVRPEDAIAAIESARSGLVDEGGVGAGTGMSCFGYKGGIGTSSRVASFGSRAFTIGALVVSNFGKQADMLLPKGTRGSADVERGDHAGDTGAPVSDPGPDGSIMIVLATDAPVNRTQLDRIAKRAAFGLARTGSFAAHGSGDIVLAFSTAHRYAHYPTALTESHEYLADDGDRLTRLFEMTAEAVEEAIWNSLCKANTTTGHQGRVRQAIPYELFR
ncbi:DmpA family aminopeptidase [Brevibacillus migulae]|uniref:DmpA family aminopeptidase n=1 Tax=Brevibacillus migulae TaxID=1644114 RepID=UPI00106E0AD2|nr:P1 family peptidase [Brevibacillus migulae]